MPDRTINLVFAPIIKNTLCNLECVFREKINRGMLCSLSVAHSVEGGGGEGVVWRRLGSAENFESNDPEIVMNLTHLEPELSCEKIMREGTLIFLENIINVMPGSTRGMLV